MSMTRLSLTDPYPFVRLRPVVGNLALKIPVATKIGVVAFVPPDNPLPDSQSQSLTASFYFSKADLERLGEISIFYFACGVIVDLLGRILVRLDELVAGPAGGITNSAKMKKEEKDLNFSINKVEIEDMTNNVGFDMVGIGKIVFDVTPTIMNVQLKWLLYSSTGQSVVVESVTSDDLFFKRKMW